MGRGRLRHGVVRLRLHGMHEIGKLHRVLDEEDGNVVADEIPVAFVGVELDGEAAHVARGVGRAAFAEHGREAHEHRGLLAGLREERRPRQRLHRLVAFEKTVRRRAARVDDALGNALVVEVRDLFAQNEVFEQRRSAKARLEGVLVVADGHALIRRQAAASRIDAHAIERPDRPVDADDGAAAPDLVGRVDLGHGAGANDGIAWADRRALFRTFENRRLVLRLLERVERAGG